MLTRNEKVQVGDRVIAELETKEGLFATSFFVGGVHRDGSLTVTTERCFFNGREGRAPASRTFRSCREAFDYVTEVA